MNHNVIANENQTVNAQKLGVFNNLFAEFKIGRLSLDHLPRKLSTCFFGVDLTESGDRKQLTKKN